MIQGLLQLYLNSFLNINMTKPPWPLDEALASTYLASEGLAT